MSAYTVVRSESMLWTVGFTKPSGTWEPESDHDSDRAAKRRAWELNGVESRFVYKRTEPGLWTVGEYDGDRWYPESDHGSAREAAAAVMELNS